MTDFTASAGGPGRGLFPEEVIVQARASEVMTQYMVCMFDFPLVAATSIVPGHETSGVMDAVFNSVRLPDTGAAPETGFIGGIFGICLDAAPAVGTIIKVLVKGLTTAQVAAATTANDMMVPATSGVMDVATGILKFKVIGIALAADAPTGFTTVLFDGVNGFGIDIGGLTAP